MAKQQTSLTEKNIYSLTDCVEYFYQNIKAENKQFVGIEHEFHIMDAVSGRPFAERRSHEIKGVLRELCRNYSYIPIQEDNSIIGAVKDGVVISIEPGGQIEVSTRPELSIAELHMQLSNTIQDIEKSLIHFRAILVSAGYCPTSTPDMIPEIESMRYRVMMPLLRRIGQDTDAQKMTASIQVSTDYNSPRHAWQCLLAGMLLQPFLVALFANSQTVDGKDSRYCSYRAHVWSRFDDVRSGVCNVMLDEGFSKDPFLSYAEWAASVPILFIERDSKLITIGDKTFNEYLLGGHQSHHPTLADWVLHLGTVFPYVRMKNVIEFRAVDSCNPLFALALAAFWKGIAYNVSTLSKVTSDYMVRDSNQLEQMYDDASRFGIHAQTHDGTSFSDVLEDLLRQSSVGLVAQKTGEEHYLDLLKDRIRTLRKTEDCRESTPAQNDQYITGSAV